MNRRELIGGLGSAAVWPGVARAQQGGRTLRIGVLMGHDENDPEEKALQSGFTRALHDLGWTEGGNLRMDVRWAPSSVDRIRVFAKELVGLQPDVILSVSTPATAAKSRPWT
jgi:putative tryptophan/tyrosine transport system substrate-binding protein